MAVFTDIYSLGPSYLDRVKSSSRIVTSMIRAWAGLFDLCANDRRAIRSLIQSIKLPIQENRVCRWLLEYGVMLSLHIMQIHPSQHCYVNLYLRYIESATGHAIRHFPHSNPKMVKRLFGWEGE